MIKDKLFFILLLFILVLIYHPWLAFDKNLSSGDWPYLYPENIKEFQVLSQPSFLWLEPYYQITSKIGVQILSLSWEATEKIFWFIPLVIINLFSSWIFIRFIFKELKINSSSYIAIGSFIYTANTYFLMLAGGGQMGVAVSYGMAPLTLYFLIKLLSVAVEKLNLKFLSLASLSLAIQLMFDPRIFILSVIAFLIYFFLYIYTQRPKLRLLLTVFKVLAIALLLNLFWIIPNISFYRQEYTLFATEPLASFLSFATFPNTISLLHPNWPENIFGKISFMKPEFILLAILPYISLLFLNLLNAKQKMTVIFLVTLGLFGSFMAKGVNPPFGEVYAFLSTLPGSSIFRDPTKFYVIIAVSYSVLIPYSLYHVSNFFNKKIRLSGNLFVAVFLVYLFVILKPAFLGQLNGTFLPHNVPSDYIKLKSFILSQNQEFNILWAPSVQRYGFSSTENRAIAESDILLLENVSSSSALLNNDKIKEQLKNLNVAYVVVPYDSLKEIFIRDRKFDNALYEKTVNGLINIKWLSLLADKNGNSRFGKIAVFKVNY